MKVVETKGERTIVLELTETEAADLAALVGFFPTSSSETVTAKYRSQSATWWLALSKMKLKIPARSNYITRDIPF